MATLLTRWLVTTLLVNVSARLPAPPSPSCYIPCDEVNCEAEIHCSWDNRLDPQFLTNYSLHWKLGNSEKEHVIEGTSHSAIIQRQDFYHNENVRVWVQAKNQYGSAISQEKVFTTEDIFKPPPPKIEIQHGAEIQWISNCALLHQFLKTCDLRYQSQVDQVWVEVYDLGLHPTYTFDNLQLCTVYEFQVRCACNQGLVSDWSPTYSVQSPKTRPVGEVDIWIGCGISSASFDCVLTWKRLSTSQDCGLSLVYNVVLSYHNGTAVTANMSTDEQGGQLVCDKKQCHLNTSLKDVSSVNVSAHNVHGATLPSYLTMPMPVKEKNDQTIHLNLNEENLSVSWDPPHHVLDNIKEYVVQYKQAGCLPDRGFDWIKVNKSQTKGTFTGQFQNYMPYEVSLFTVSHSSEVRHLASSIGYSLEGTPSIVPLFSVSSIAATCVTLLWEPVPLCKRNGVILKYQIGIDRQKVYTVNATQQHENLTFEVLHLSPGQDYEVWINAVTKAGPGENATTRFKTKHHEGFEHLIWNVLVTIGILFLFVICFSIYVVRACQGESKACLLAPSCFYEKVPDPRNSHIFRQMKHQINDPFAWIFIPVNEPHPKICLLEVVETQPWASKSSLEKTADTGRLTRQMVSQIDSQDDQEEDAVTEESQKTENRRKAYSKMVDSDEEEAREDFWSSSEEEPCCSGYEKHFMPTASEILV